MRSYTNKIALIKNQRGIYCLDTSIGCASGMAHTDGGCYNDCYAAKSAKIYGYDFSKTVLRNFINRKHETEIVNKINKVKLDFIRIGCSGDPSENWEHCFTILKVISKSIKEIVIITKHWSNLTDEQLLYLKSINVCINTSVSALDDYALLVNSLYQYNRLKPFCKSILRIVSCDFNLENTNGHELYKIQKHLFNNDNIIDTIFRPSRKNKLVTENIINSKVGVFNGSKQLMSKYNKKTYSGKCSSCKEMCGISIVDNNHIFPVKRVKQLKLL
jgi:hypothetical protein